MSPRSQEDHIIELTDIIEEGEPLDSSGGDSGPGGGIEAELNDLFADFDSNRPGSEPKKGKTDDDIDFDAIFAESEATAGQAEEGSFSESDAGEGLDLESLFEEDDASPEGLRTEILGVEGEGEGIELDSLFEDEDQESGVAENVSANNRTSDLDDLFMDDEVLAAEGKSSNSDQQAPDFDSLFADVAESGSRTEREDIPEFDGTVEEIEEFDLSDLSAEISLEGDEELTLEPEGDGAGSGASSEDFLMDLEEPARPVESSTGGGGADLSELDALIAGLEGEEQSEEEELSHPSTQAYILDDEQEFKLDEESEGDLPKDLLEAGFETEAVETLSTEAADAEFERVLPRIEEEVAQRIEERMAALSADWTEREQNLLLAIDRIEKENESLRSMLEDRSETVTREDLDKFKQELRAELSAEMKRSVPEEAAAVIREEISALLKSLHEE